MQKDILWVTGLFMICLQTEDTEWEPEIRVPYVSEYVTLNRLKWNTKYDVVVVAENQQGKSKPGTLTVITPTEPAATTGDHHPLALSPLPARSLSHDSSSLILTADSEL